MGIISKVQPGHVGLNVTDLERSRQFYQAVFGFELVHVSEEAGRRFVFLGDGERLALTLWQQSEGRFAAARPGLHHLSFEVESMAEVEAFERRLAELKTPLLYDGIVPHAEGSPSGGLFFEDPDGIRLEIYSPTGAESQPAAGDGPACGFF